MAAPLPHAGLAGPLSIYVAARDGFMAGRIRHALEREGFQLMCEWGTLAELPHRERRNIEVVVVVETEAAPTSESELAAIRESAARARVVVVSSARDARPQQLRHLDAVVVEPGADAVVGPVVRAVLSDYLVVPRPMRTVVEMPSLTAHERELLALVADGLTNREIAKRLYLAESTVKRHVSALFRRLGVSSRYEAAAAAAVLTSAKLLPQEADRPL